MRIGFGYDVHKLVRGRKLIIGGVEIPHNKGLLGHSDADVLLHAVCDSLLGAAGFGDIGKHFPDNDAKYKNINSRILLKETVNLLNKNGFKIVNLDATIIAQEPKMAPFIENMRQNIAADCGIEAAFVNVKATTEEGLGFTGAKKGIAANCVSLIE
ncbi:MAG: 2-C-methyl-D-erythritol 2,4-cyclodiphosphate synthase [Clostridia bacterium]|nr:2-C-methyl-D-erythritol 2,4-cyclodiphosphate synthase [Clostridia bacterium]